MKIKIKITSEYLYYYVLVLLLLNNWWGDLRVFPGLYQAFKPLVLGSAIVMILVLMFEKSYTFIELAVAFSLIAIGAYTSFLTGSKWTLYSMILVAFAKNINIQVAIKIVYRCMSVFILIAVSIFLFQYVFVPSSLLAHKDGTVIKYGMTFIGANEAARYWIFWFVLFLYVNAEKRIPILKKLLIFTVTIFFYLCTLSDTLLLILAMSMLVYLGHRTGFRKFVEKYGGYSFVGLWILSLLILRFENSLIYNVINKFVTGRLTLGKLGFETYGISMFGQSNLEFFYWMKRENSAFFLVVDNAYYMMMIQYGTFYLILISFLFLKARKRIDFRSSCCLILYSVIALAENTILSPTAIFPVIIAANLSWKAQRERVSFYECVGFQNNAIRNTAYFTNKSK
ncbi:MAG: hypothetical protein J1E64_00295 [Acetatifactor sp.]|nr:hypothetical protein [Acetatifactor sp.]